MTTPSTRKRPFDEALLSGYLDHSLTQQESQRVRLHLEANPEDRRVLEEMKLLREAAQNTPFVPLRDEEWPEVPRSQPSRWSRSAGWIVLAGWFLLTAALLTWKALHQASSLLEVFLFFGLPGAFLLLLVSVGLDRRHRQKSDRYDKRVHR